MAFAQSTTQMLEATSSCPAAEEEQERIFQSQYVKDLNKKNQVWLDAHCVGGLNQLKFN